MIDYKLSETLKVNYQTAKPFPYIIIDNFLPKFLLEKCKDEILNHKIWYSDGYEWTKEYQQNKFYYPTYHTDPKEFKHNLPLTSFVIDYLNSDEFISFLKNLTGFPELFRDHNLLGGGIHRIKKGGKLSVHIDYNEHPGTFQHRKLNLLLYLNENWKSEWNGNLELWSKDLKNKLLEIEPIFNRAVIFNIEDAPHGHPTPLNTPDDIDRYSLALYYFSSEILPTDKKHTVIFYKESEIGDNTNNLENLFK